jgi:ubiquinone/menaquinone biosynthesis C-methylase UbiE
VGSAFDGMWSAIGRQFRLPAGFGGRVMGRVMELMNAAPNREAIAALEIAPTDVVLEIGFGPGCAVEALAALAPKGKVFGVDPSEEMLTSASRRNRRAIGEGRVRLMKGCADDLRLEPESIDKILAVNVAYFFEDDREFIAAQCILKPGGKMAIYVTDKSSMSQWKFASPATHRLFGRAELAAMIGRAGFDDRGTSIREIDVAPGVKGLVATARKRPLSAA